MIMDEEVSLICPFCGFRALEYGMLLHMEQRHAEGESPFVPQEEQGKGGSASSSFYGTTGGAASMDDRDNKYAECPVDGCGEFLLVDEMDYHIDLHVQEAGVDELEQNVSLAASGDGGGTASGSSIGIGNISGSSRPAVIVSPNPTPAAELGSEQAGSSSRFIQRHNTDCYRSHRREREERNRQPSDGGSGSGRGSSSNHGRSSRASAIHAWRELLNMPSTSTGSSGSSSGSGRPSRREHRSHRGSSSTATTTTTTTATSAGSSGTGNSITSESGVALALDNQHQHQHQLLGKAELGKYAHEKQMPDWLVAHLRKGWGVRAEGVVPIIEQLLEQSPTTRYAYLCHPCVQHVSKLKREGGFCGYRNIQMMASYINAVRFQGWHNLGLNRGGELPSIFQIQDWIEAAWDRGINAQGRVETGGVRGTRKYIGTPEAQAVFCNLDVPCEAQGFKSREAGRSEARLLHEVERYFESGDLDPDYKVRRTNLPPIYFQHAGHSMTIIGLERLKGGATNLLVFDPMFHDSGGVLKLVGREFDHLFPDLALKPYRRGNKYLKKYREFEVLRLRPPANLPLPN